MRVCIHRGTHQIGGTCIELESHGKRLVLDIGLPLDAETPENVPLPPVKGFDRPDESLLGIIISHGHADHYGLAPRLCRGVRFFMGQAAHGILEAARPFIPRSPSLEQVTYLVNRKPIDIGPFRLTPFLVDHSAYDAYAVLVEADGKRLFYSGDLRAHGRKAKLFEALLRRPPMDVDVLLMEGTMLGRADENCPSEEDLVPQMTQLMRDTPGLALVYCSGQNIDRLVTVFKAARKAGRQLILDGYIAHILKATGNVQHPNRLLPHEGVVVSTTSGHSPAWAFLYIVTKSRLLLPQGDGVLRRCIQTSSVSQSSIGVKTQAPGISQCRDKHSPRFDFSARFFMSCPRVVLSDILAPSTRITSPKRPICS